MQTPSEMDGVFGTKVLGKDYFMENTAINQEVISPAAARVVAQSPLEDALRYASQFGWAVVPYYPIRNGQCACGNPDCNSPGKHPISALARHGFKDATHDPKRIRGWWSGDWADANIAIATGSVSGAGQSLVVVDVDTGSGKRGRETLAQLQSEHPDGWDTLQAQSGGGGVHYYFRSPRKLRGGNNKLGDHIDVKTDGGCVHVAPSSHISGGQYTWVNEKPIAPLPEWMAAILEPRSSPRPPSAPDETADAATIARVTEALTHLDADDYDRWLQVGMALKLAGLPLEVWDCWSRGSEKYDEAACEAKWESFQREMEGEVVRLGSIFYWAWEAGWAGGGTWCEAELEHAQEAVSQAIARVEAVDSAEARKVAAREMLRHGALALAGLKDHRRAAYIEARERLQPLTGLGRRDFDAVVVQEAQAHRQTVLGQGEDARTAFLRRFVYQTKDNIYTCLETGVCFSPKVFRMLAEQACPGLWEGRDPEMDFAGLDGSLFVRHDVYEPGEIRIIEAESTDGVVAPLINVYNAPGLPEPRYGAAREALFLDHLYYISGGDPIFVEYLLNWMATLIQKPGQRINSAPVLISAARGTGKSFIGDVMTRLLGEKNVGVLSNHDLTSSFQDGLGFKQLLMVEEVKVFENQYGLMDSLKGYITNQRIPLNRKNRASITVKNVGNWIFYSNHEDALRIDTQERRYAVAINYEQPKSEGYYNQLFGTLLDAADEGPAALLYLLRNRDLTSFNPYAPAPHTKARDEMIDNTRPALESAVIEGFEKLLEGNPHIELMTFGEAYRHTKQFVQFAQGIKIGSGVSQHRATKALDVAGLVRLKGQKRLTQGDGSKQKHIIYCVRNHERWAEASENDIDAYFQATLAARMVFKH
ncbi:MAG: bifunctional DNA primase/polymerase [Candidatus Competibacteraceae bacterium]|nr:MAG: bifunctional DNA primase/polymerase [Candidatus Competibacteraceae bacterium]